MPVLRWTLLAIVILVALVVASLTAEPGQWQLDVRWANERAVSMVSSAFACPVLVGEELSGNAREQYEEAAKLAATIDSETTERLRQLARGVAPRDGEVAEIMRTVAPAMTQLCRASRTRGAVFDLEELGSTGGDFVPFDSLLPMADALLVAAQNDADADQRLDAWLHALTCGVDLTGAESLVLVIYGAMIVERATEVADERWLAGLTGGALRRMADAAAMADDVLAQCNEHGASLAVHFVRLLERHTELQPYDLGFGSRMQAWRQGFSLWHAGVERASAVVEQIRNFERQTPVRESWQARKARLDAIEAWDRSANGDLSLGYLRGVTDCEVTLRTAVAELRLLRLALAFHLGDELPRLADPLGDGPLGVEPRPDGLRCFSAEADIERTVGR